MRANLFTIPIIVYLYALFVFYGCAGISAGQLNYYPPAPVNNIQNTVMVEKSKDRVWSELIPKLAKNFFVINNLDKDSGLINISYSGDPERYIDCGRIYSFVENLQGKRTYDFQAAKASQIYEVIENGKYAKITRKISLDGRMNIIVEALGPERTMVTVNTRYLVTRRATINQYSSYPRSLNDTISFNTGGSVVFPQGTTCCCTGAFETTIIGLIAD